MGSFGREILLRFALQGLKDVLHYLATTDHDTDSYKEEIELEDPKVPGAKMKVKIEAETPTPKSETKKTSAAKKKEAKEKSDSKKRSKKIEDAS